MCTERNLRISSKLDLSGGLIERRTRSTSHIFEDSKYALDTHYFVL